MKRKLNIALDKQGKARLNLRLPPSLLQWVKLYCDANHMSVTQVIINSLTDLRRSIEGEHADQF